MLLNANRRIGVPGAILLSATLLTLTGPTAQAQVNIGGNCIHPPNASYADGGTHLFSFTSFYIPPTITVLRITNLVLGGFGDCSAPPPSVPGSATTVDLSGMIDYDYDVYCAENCDSPGEKGRPRIESHDQQPITGTMVVTFSHEDGPTRYFFTTIQFAPADPGGFGLHGSGSGSMSIEDLGDGTYRFVSRFGSPLTSCDDLGVGLDCEPDGGDGAILSLGGVALTDVPRASGARTLALAPPAPNPVRTRARLRFTLPSDERVTLKVYDLAGRQVSSLLDGLAMSAGPHDAELDTEGWRSGYYFCRLAAGPEQRTQSLLIVR